MTTMRKSTQFGSLQIAIILLTVATAVIHLALGLSGGFTMFILNGLGYLALLAALLLPQLSPYRTYTRWALLVFAAVTVLAWVAIGQRSTIAYIDKLIEVALIVCLFLAGRQ